VNELGVHSGSSELPLFSRSYVTSYVVYSNNVSKILHHFLDITTFAVYVNACDTEKSFSFNQKLKLQTTCTFQLTCKHTVGSTHCMCYISWGMGVMKVSNRDSKKWSSR